MERIILDVDTGHDDAVAIELAAGSPGIKIEALIATAGNTSLENALENTLNIADALHIDAPVYAGSSGPLLRKRVSAGSIHGENGLAGPVFAPRAKQAEKGNAIEFIIRTVMDNPGQISFVSVGPYTDLAIALKAEPRLAGALKRIVLMGGSSGKGNVTPAAEFNIFADPEAAQIVLRSGAAGADVYLMPLDCTLGVMLDDRRIKEIGSCGGRVSEIFLASMEHYVRSCLEYIHDYPAMHDPCCIAYLIDPSLFRFTDETIEVETKGDINYGRTTLMWPDSGCKVHFARKIDSDGFWKVLKRGFAGLSGIKALKGQQETEGQQETAGQRETEGR